MEELKYDLDHILTSTRLIVLYLGYTPSAIGTIIIRANQLLKEGYTQEQMLLLKQEYDSYLDSIIANMFDNSE